MKVLISQSMYFPWVGLIEQVCFADIFVHYDDVQYTRGFYNRVQIMTPQGSKWMTIPLQDQHRGQNINQVKIDDRVDWRAKHKEMLRINYSNTPFFNEMMSVVDLTFSRPIKVLPDITKASIISICEYYGLTAKKKFFNSSDLGIGGSGSQRLLEIAKAMGASVYVTGHGAKNYLDHAIFEKSGIEVQYMDYQCIPYPQKSTQFTPYVTALDLISNCGKSGIDNIRPKTINWRKI